MKTSNALPFRCGAHVAARWSFWYSIWLKSDILERVMIGEDKESDDDADAQQLVAVKTEACCMFLLAKCLFYRSSLLEIVM